MPPPTLAAVTIAVPLALGCGAERDAPAGVSVEYIAHASFRVTSSSGSRLVVDPYGSRIWIGYDFPADVETDAVLISHPHYDHDGGVSRGLEFPWDSTIVPVYREPGSYRVGDMSITGIRGKHADPYGVEFGQINTVWLIEADGVRIAHWGDNGPITEPIRDALGAIDVLMLPIDARYHILSQAAIDDIVRQTGVSRLVPMHYALPQLEPGELPDDLGAIEPWVANRASVEHVGVRMRLIANETPASFRIVVFEPGACQSLAMGC